VEFSFSAKVEELREKLLDMMESHVYPAEPIAADQITASGNPAHHPEVLEELKTEARKRGLWNLFLPNEQWGAGLTNLEYAPLAEIMGRSPSLAPEACNCSAPDTGNMELLAEFGTAEQQQRWLQPLLEGEIRSCFAMTEPDVASSDATNISSRIARDGDHYVINGRKWWTSGAGRARTKLCIFMGVTDPEADAYRRQSMVLVPMDTPGVSVVRNLPVFGYQDRETHSEVMFEDVRVPVGNLLGNEGDGFAIAQARLGPGRIHHCMRLIGMAERALEMMCSRATKRVAFGKELARQGVVQEWIADARVEIEMVRLLVLKTAWLMDTVGNKGARIEISAIKIAAPRMATRILDRAIQLHGGGGVADDFPLAAMYAGARTLHLADGPDEVHKMALARRELGRYLPKRS